MTGAANASAGQEIAVSSDWSAMQQHVAKEHGELQMRIFQYLSDGNSAWRCFLPDAFSLSFDGGTAIFNAKSNSCSASLEAMATSLLEFWPFLRFRRKRAWLCPTVALRTAEMTICVEFASVCVFAKPMLQDK